MTDATKSSAPSAPVARSDRTAEPATAPLPGVPGELSESSDSGISSERGEPTGPAQPSGPKEPPTTSESSKANAPKPARPPLAEQVKAWGDAGSSLLKALLLALAVVIVGAVAGTAIWRDQRARHIVIAIDPETEKSLRLFGSELDLRQVLVDALNDEVRGVQQIVKLSFSQLVDTRSANDVSFKPFGLDATTGQLTGLVREVVGSPPHASVRVELMCAPLPCTRLAEGTRLLVTLSDGAGSQRLTFPVARGQPGLRRSLRGAMQRSAELLLERTEPTIASIYYLNLAAQRRFPDQLLRDNQRAMGSALKLRDADGAASCVANLVIGVSLMQRGNPEDGYFIEERAGASPDVVCQVHAATNIVLMAGGSVCAADPGQRANALAAARVAYKRVAGRTASALPPLVFDRIPSAEIVLAQLTSLFQPGNEPARGGLVRRPADRWRSV